MDGLELAGIRFAAGGREILQGISLTVESGESVAILGPSGSGKTTLLRIVAGLERPTAGTVRFGGSDLTETPAHRRGFGMMFQDHALFPHLNVAKNIEFGLRPPNWDRPSRGSRRREMLEMVGLPGFDDRTIEKLSGGERQRVALARALAPQPAMLMLDEPLGSLDRGLRDRLAGEVREILSRLKITSLYVTHDQAEAFAVADMVAIINDGKLARLGSPRDIWNEPATEFVARFLGMENVVDGTRDSAGLITTVLGDFGPLPGPEGNVRVLLRGEGASLASEPGPNIASGLLEQAVFRGGTIDVRLEQGATRATFALPDGDPIIAKGQAISVHVPRVQVLAG
jgi:ABC-type Fe3+/spermidine/putrescine transport system ATPase subunit